MLQRRHSFAVPLWGMAGVLAAVTACAEPPAREIHPGESVGPITGETTPEELRRAFPPGTVAFTDVALGEGFTRPGAVVYPNDEMRRLEVLWTDTLKAPRAEMVVLRGDSSEWKTADGLTLGTTLAELERLNGIAFRLTGFGWDYSGTVVDWNGGRLAPDSGASHKLVVRLLPDDAADVPSHLLGDRDFASDDSAMAALAPHVAEIYVRLR